VWVCVCLCVCVYIVLSHKPSARTCVSGGEVEGESYV